MNIENRLRDSKEYFVKRTLAIRIRYLLVNTGNFVAYQLELFYLQLTQKSSYSPLNALRI